MKKRLSKKQMIIFALGQFGWSLLGGIISAWLVTYFLPTGTEVDNGAIPYIIPGLAIGGFLTVIGLITALSRVFDAVSDPLIASLSDRSKNKRGRRIPFMQVAAIPFAVVTVLLFTIDFGRYDGGTGWANILWVSVMIVLFYLFMTMYCTPYNALISEFGQNQEDRMFISTAISFTYLFGTLFAYIPFVLAEPLRNAGLSYAWSYRVCFIVLASVACVAMLLPTFLLKETDFIDPKPSNENVFKSLTATFKNKDFRVFSGSDIMYWVGLTMFQTGLPYFVKVSMGLKEGMVIVFMGGMSVLAAVFYPFVTKLVKKFGKKKLVIAGFLGLALCYAIAAISSIPGVCPPEQSGGNALSWVFGVAIMVISALPMALLGIIPQSIVADVAEAEAKTTGQNREGMFFAARTFAMKFGQSLAMILFTSLAVSMAAASASGSTTEVYPSKAGLIIVAAVAVAFCVLGAVILMFYREKRVMKIIAKEEDKAFLQAVEEDNEPVEEVIAEPVDGDNE